MGNKYLGHEIVGRAIKVGKNISQNFADFKEVVDEAHLELERIKLEVAKTNSSLETSIETSIENEN